MSRGFQLVITKPEDLLPLQLRGLPDELVVDRDWAGERDADGEWSDYPDHFCVACGLCKVPGCSWPCHAEHQCDIAEGKVRLSRGNDPSLGISAMLQSRFRDLERLSQTFPTIQTRRPRA